MSCSLLWFLVDSSRDLSGRRCQEAKPGLGNTRAGDHESGCGPSQVMHGKDAGPNVAGWLTGWLGSRCCRIEDPEKRYVRSLTRLDLVDHCAGGSGHDPSTPGGPLDTMQSTATSSLNTRETASAEEVLNDSGARPGWQSPQKPKAQTAFSFTSCVRQDYSQKRLNSSPKEGLTNHTMGIVLKHDAFQCRPQSKWSPSLPSRTPNPSREIENEKSADGHCHQGVEGHPGV